MIVLLAAAAATLLCLVFAQAAWHKLADFTAFTGYVSDYRLLPGPLERPAAMGLAAAEVLIVAGLLLPSTRGLAASGAAALLLLYTTAIAINLARGRRGIDCGCGGTVQPLSLALVARNLALAAAALVVATAPTAPLGVAGAASGLATGFLGWALLGAAEQLLANAAVTRNPR